MKQRTWAITVAALLLAGSGLALATNVKGQDFERKGALEDPGAAYHLEWDSEDAGTLRLSLDPAEGAASPSAIVSLYEGAERVGTYTLDDAWPRLDHKVDPGAEHTLIVHRALDAEVDVLAEEGHPVDLDKIELASDHVDLVSGEDEAIRTQIAFEREDPFAHLALTFEGDAEDLTVEMLNADDETVLEATAPRIDTTAGQRLVADVNPDAFQTGSLVVRVTADALNGSLGVDVLELTEESSHVVEAKEDPDRDKTRADGEDASGQDDADTSSSKETDQVQREEQASEDTLRRITDIEAGEPLAIEVPAGVEALHVVGEEDCGVAVLFGPDDAVLGQQMLDREEGASTWEDEEASDEEPSANSSEDEADKVVATLPVEEAGEHVILFEDSHEAATLYMRVDEDVDHRVLETSEIRGQIDGGNRTLFASSNASANETLEGGLVGFSWDSHGVDMDREVRLAGPSGDTLYEAHGASVGPARAMGSSQAADPLVGPAGDYTITTESRSAIEDGISYTLVAYQR